MDEPKKTCFKCGAERPLSEFYRHPMMADGHLNKCKECAKQDVKKNYEKKVDYYRTYDKSRNKSQKRRNMRQEYLLWYEEAFPEKIMARRILNHAIRDGKLIRLPCERCGRKDGHAHHEDYSRPLDVVWLCPPHHRQRHEDMKAEGKSP